MRVKSNHQDLLKLLAIVAMIFDHLGLYFFPDQPIFRVIGRFAMPAFCFFAGYNLKDKPRFELLIYGALLYAVSIVIFGQFTTANILISIFLGQYYIHLQKNRLKIFEIAYIHVIILSLFWVFSWEYIDYGTLSIAIILLGYTAKQSPSNLKLAVAVAVILSIFHTITVFSFSNIYLILSILIALGEYYLFVRSYFDKEIGFNIRVISRNTLIIYFVHVIIIQFIWLFWVI